MTSGPENQLAEADPTVARNRDELAAASTMIPATANVVQRASP